MTSASAPPAALLILIVLTLKPAPLVPPAAATAVFSHLQPLLPAADDVVVPHESLARFFRSDAFAALTSPVAFVGGVPGMEEEEAEKVLPNLVPLEKSVLDAAVREDAAKDAAAVDPVQNGARLRDFLMLFECPFCLFPVTSSQFEVTTCGHVFHPTCLRLTKSGRCPLCNNATPYRRADVVEHAFGRVEALLKELEYEGLLSPEIRPDAAEDSGRLMKLRISEHLGLVSGVVTEVADALRSCAGQNVLRKMRERFSRGLAVPNAFCHLTSADLRTLTANYMVDAFLEDKAIYKMLTDYGGPVFALGSDESGGDLVFGLPDRNVLIGASEPVRTHRISWECDALPNLLQGFGIPAAALGRDDRGSLFVGNLPVGSILTSRLSTARPRELRSQLLVDMTKFAELAKPLVRPGLIIPSLEVYLSTALTLGRSNDFDVPATVAAWLESVDGFVQENLSRELQGTDPLSLFKEPSAWRHRLHECDLMLETLIDATMMIAGDGVEEYDESFLSTVYVLGGDPPVAR